MSAQALLFDLVTPGTDPEPPIPFARGSETSRAAAESIAPQLSRLEQLVVDVLVEHGPQTCDAVEEMTGLPHQTISARFNGLARRGRIRRLGERRPTRSGRMAEVWVLA